jgi:hypothetical protein
MTDVTLPPQMLQLRGQLTSAHMRQTTPMRFVVPEGVTHIHFRFQHSPKFAPDQKLPYQISLMIFDTHGPRFEISRPDDQGVFINAAQASPGGTPGPVSAGEWMVFILVHRIMSDSPVAYTLDITMSFDPLTATPQTWTPGKVAPRGPGWYRGDLHAHSIHSDGSLDIPDLVRFWRERGVDFMTLSDHNTISGLPQVRSLADDQLLTLGGIELSTYWGHAVAVGVHQWFDWRKLDGTQITMRELAQQVIDAGCLFTIAHPNDPGDPLCCGCRWEHYDMMPGNALAVEVWNGYWSPRNQEALTWFYRWLNEGRRVTAVSGTDLHSLPREQGPQGRRGAVNVVYAQELSEAAILTAIKAGHSYLSAGPELLLTATTAAGETAMIGDTLTAAQVAQGPVTVCATWQGSDSSGGIRLVVNGKVYREKKVGAAGELRWELAQGTVTPEAIGWCAVELRDEADTLLAVTNPIFFG